MNRRNRESRENSSFVEEYDGESAATWQEQGGLASVGSSPDAQPPMLSARESPADTRRRAAGVQRRRLSLSPQRGMLALDGTPTRPAARHCRRKALRF